MQSIFPDKRDGLVFSVEARDDVRYYAACGICGFVEEVGASRAHDPGFSGICDACYDEHDAATDTIAARQALADTEA